MLAHGHDAIGNLLIGEQARERFLEMPESTPVERATAYPALALAAGAGEAPGSSAGGEQPKFCTYTERSHVLMKFSAPDDNTISKRWRDLLLAEHLALRVLGVETEVYDFGRQRFLEIPRFDRVGQLGRIGIFSLRALDAEFVGNARAHWPVLVNSLITEGHVHPYAAAGGAMVNELRPASLPEVISRDIWQEAPSLAENFFVITSSCERFSANFIPCLEKLRHHLDEVRSRIDRLG